MDKNKKIKKSKEGTSFGRKTFILSLLILAQLFYLSLYIVHYSMDFKLLYVFLFIVNILVVLKVLSSQKNYASRLAWVVLLLSFSPFASVIYIIFGQTSNPKRKTKLMHNIFQKTKIFEKKFEIPQNLTNSIINDCKLIFETTKFTPSFKSQTELLTPGEKTFEILIQELKSATKFIFMEYFIIGDGKLFSEIKKILIEKAKNNVDVRIIYDDIGSSRTLNNKTIYELEKSRIKVCAFNKLRPVLDFFMNYRDHRKITIIDGKTAFTGGHNIADEYANYKQIFGYWKDTSVLVKGEAVYNFTLMFLRNWEFCVGEYLDYERFLFPSEALDFPQDENNLILPFADSPMNQNNPSKRLFSRFITEAKKYIYIQSPYLIIDDVMVENLTTAALSGIDVKIFLPGSPDKKLIYSVTRSYYKQLLDGGVKIYEYTPGFLHSKVLLSDDEKAFVGTVNMDYRSFYTQHECGVYYAGGSIIGEIKNDILVEIFNKSKEITLLNYPKTNSLQTFFLAIIKIFAPLM